MSFFPFSPLFCTSPFAFSPQLGDLEKLPFFFVAIDRIERFLTLKGIYGEPSLTAQRHLVKVMTAP